MPALWLFQNSLRNAGSVAARCVTAYCVGVSFCFSSSGGGFWYFCIALLVDGDGTTAGCDVAFCDTACEYAANPAAARAAAATSQTIGFTVFIEDNSTRWDATKIRIKPLRPRGLTRS